MPINIINILTESFFYILLCGITFSNTLVEVSIAVIIVLFVIKKIVSKKIALPKTPVNIALYLLCAVTFASFLRSAYFVESIRGSIRIVKFVFLYFALYDYFTSDKKRITRTFWALMIISALTYLNGIFQSFSGFDILRHREVNSLDGFGRISASFVHPNDFGAYIIFLLPLSLSLFYPSMDKKRKIFLSVNCLLATFCLLKTSSRAAWLGILIGILVYFFFYKRKISVLVPAGIILFIILSPHGFERLRSLFVLEQNTVWERIQLWKGTWNMVKVHPFLGFGVNTFSRYFLEYKPVIYPDIRYTHNSYLQMWSEIGILGMGSFIAIIFIVIKETLRDIRKKMQRGLEGFILLGVFAGYIAFLIQSGLDTNLYSLVLTTFFWITNAYIMSLNKIFKEDTGKNG